MNVYVTESEQLEQLRELWKKYGVSTIVGVVLALVLSLAWRHWLDLRERAFMHASVRYEQLLSSVLANDAEGVKRHAVYLIDRYPKTNYAKLAALQLARQAVNAGDLPTAAEKLGWVAKTASLDALRATAQVRLARVQLALQQPELALDTLKKVHDEEYAAVASEAKGDVYVRLGKLDQARVAYAEAIKTLPALVSERPLLEMKLDNLR